MAVAIDKTGIVHFGATKAEAVEKAVQANRENK